MFMFTIILSWWQKDIFTNYVMIVFTLSPINEWILLDISFHHCLHTLIIDTRHTLCIVRSQYKRYNSATFSYLLVLFLCKLLNVAWFYVDLVFKCLLDFSIAICQQVGDIIKKFSSQKFQSSNFLQNIISFAAFKLVKCFSLWSNEQK